jgi:hypothetical protein
VADAAVIFVHGLFSSPATWDPLIELLKGTDRLSEAYTFMPFRYESPKWNLNPTRRIPNFAVIAASLKTFLETECEDYQNIVIIESYSKPHVSEKKNSPRAASYASR